MKANTCPFYDKFKGRLLRYFSFDEISAAEAWFLEIVLFFQGTLSLPVLVPVLHHTRFNW